MDRPMVSFIGRSYRDRQRPCRRAPSIRFLVDRRDLWPCRNARRRPGPAWWLAAPQKSTSPASIELVVNEYDSAMVIWLVIALSATNYGRELGRAGGFWDGGEVEIRTRRNWIRATGTKNSRSRQCCPIPC